MPDVVVDSSCLIVLEKTRLLFVLERLYGTIIITSKVQVEFDRKLERWMQVRDAVDTNYIRLR